MTTFRRRAATILAISASIAILFLTVVFYVDAPATRFTDGFFHPVVGDTARPERGPVTYIPFTFGFAMLLQTLRGYQFAGWPNIVIVDNSWDGLVHAKKEWLRERYGVLDVVTTPVHLRFTQLQAFLDKMAQNAGESYYFWSHTDILLLTDDQHAYRRAKQCIEQTRQRSTSPKGLGVMFIDYDRLSAISVAAGNAVPWDPATPQYGSDCDRYARMRLAGYDVVDCNETHRIGRVAHVHAVMTEEEQERFFQRGDVVGGEGGVHGQAQSGG